MEGACVVPVGGWIGSISLGVVVLYVLGILVRGQYGIAVSVHNLSEHSLREVKVRLEPQGKDYNLGELADLQRNRVFVQPRTESHIALQYTDANGPHVETVVGYVESGYCGKAEIKILPANKLTSSEEIDPIFCRKSWFDFM